jgi:hypothetical protein
MAQKAGLMPTKDKFSEEKQKDPTKKLNCYWDEKTIDIQWNERQKRSKRYSLEKM